MIESIKAVSDLYTAVSGEVVNGNDDLKDQPEQLNEDPYGDGWMIVEMDNESELDQALSADLAPLTEAFERIDNNLYIEGGETSISGSPADD